MFYLRLLSVPHKKKKWVFTKLYKCRKRSNTEQIYGVQHSFSLSHTRLQSDEHRVDVQGQTTQLEFKEPLWSDICFSVCQRERERESGGKRNRSQEKRVEEGKEMRWRTKLRTRRLKTTKELEKNESKRERKGKKQRKYQIQCGLVYNHDKTVHSTTNPGF